MDTAIILASNWDSPKDLGKLLKLEQGNINVISVSDNECKTHPEKHIHTDFRVRTTKICDYIRSIKPTSNKITVILDHAYLANGYYTWRYGLDWISKKAMTFLESGASELFLPRDNGGELDKMLSCPNPSLSIEYVDTNPYFAAAQSALKDIPDEKEREKATFAELHYTTNIKRFVRIVEEKNPPKKKLKRKTR